MVSSDKSSIDDQAKKLVNGSIQSIFTHADGVDRCLMALGFIGAVFDGVTDRLSLLFAAQMINTIGSASKLDNDVLHHNLNKVPNFVSNVSLFIGGYMVAFILVWQLGMVALPFAILLVVPGWLCGRSLMDLSGKIRREYNKAGTIAEHAISSIRTVYAFVGENKTVEEFSAALHGSIKLGLRQGLVKGLAIGSSATVIAIWSFLSYYGSRLVMYEGTPGGTIFAAGISIVNGGLALGQGLSNIKGIMDACSASIRIMEMIKRIPKIDSEDMEGMILEHVSGQIEFKEVNFSYPSRPESVIFKKFSLTIPAGKTVALVGASGSGKSTALSLLQRFYDPLDGEILLDGIGIDKLQLRWLRSQMALVSQEPSLFSATIKKNILFGNEDATMEEILEASEASDAHNFIYQLPQGYDTQARAIIRKPRILLLDEATSALDSESESVVQKAIDKVVVGRTTIIIAHRLSTIKNVDVIFVVENGEVKKTVLQDDLIGQENDLYTSLVNLQEKKKNSKEEYNCVQSSSSNKNNNTTRNKSLSGVNNIDPCNFGGRGTICVVDRNDDSEDLKITTPFWRLLALNKPEWKQVSLGCLSAILFGAVQPFCAFTMGTMLSVYFLTDHNEIKGKIRNSALGLFGLSLFSLLINISQHYNFAYMGEYLTKRIREAMLSKVFTFEVGWFDKDENCSSVICSRLSKDANMVRSLVGDGISFLVQTTSAVTIAWTMGLVIAWRLAIVSIAVQPLLIMCLYARRVTLKNMSRKAIKEQDESTKLAAEAVSNFRTITAFSSQERILKWLEKAQEAPQIESIRQSWFAGIALGCSLSLKSCSWAFNNWYGGKLVSQGRISPRQVFQTVQIVMTTGYAIAEAASMTATLTRGWDAISSIFAILDKKTKIEPENLEGYKPEKIMGHVEIRDVHFAYPSRPDVMIFKGFSLKIKAGTSMALVGKSGSGKSTIIGLIERFYDPISGVVTIDGQDIKSYHLRSLRKYVALVNQEPTLFDGTIRENITYGLPNNITESEIIEAAKAANAHDFIMGQKDRYETWCGDRGLQLSGGQKQRVAIARAILRDPAVLLLDEATSALDRHAEKLVQIALERMMMGRTSIVVAHRLCTIQNCDEIAVIDKGEVVEKGMHSTLMAKGQSGNYHSLMSLQTSEETNIVETPHGVSPV
ncbi:ABC transporter [Parasponia andersonii]|uniref:ABC transporter n=1 Tax=Parasponia andersonii TaxID=3476 RepID=A0A2P5CEC4_PARAD|nr:ABC transporter [Parasponia andersonii]